MYILGISAYYHDSAAALLKDGCVVVAIQEERLTRIKHDKSFPVNAIHKCMEITGINISDIDSVVYYEKPFWKFERILDTITNYVPFSFSQFSSAIPLWVKNRLWISTEIRKKLNFKGKVLYASHHESHAASAYYSSGFEHSAIITIDGVGEYATTTIGIGQHQKLEIIKEQHFPHSLGLLYSAFTQYCGFKVNSGEYKLMGLAPYGKPLYKQKIYDHFLELFEDGSYSLNMKYFSYAEGRRMINKHFEAIWGKPTRKEEAPVDQFYMDVAASIQEVLEEVVLKLCQSVKQLTQATHVVLAGGVALNCKLNQKIVESKIFNNHYFYPSPGDAGSAVGAAYLGWYHYHGKDKPKENESAVYLGNQYINDEIKAVLDSYGIPYQVIANSSERIADRLSEGKIIGWFNGRMEFGPRALGSRSILADPRHASMKDILNEKIKLREGFRPFAPMVLDSEAPNYFELFPANYDTMMVTAKSKNGAELIMPAVIHQDGTARIQLVNELTNPEIFEVLNTFFIKTNCPAMINTSFNVRGEPIVESPIDALRVLLYTDIDLLVFNNSIWVDKNFDLEKVRKQIKMITYAAD